MIPLRLGKKPHKYKARALTMDGIRFDSTAEAQHYAELKIRERAGEITDIAVHPGFPIEFNGVFICRVVADFGYWDIKANVCRIEDVKGMDTALSKLKRKLVLACHGVAIELVRKKRRW